MADLASMRSSVAGSVGPTVGFGGYGGDYDMGGNTVTFGDVDTFVTTSGAPSTTGTASEAHISPKPTTPNITPAPQMAVPTPTPETADKTALRININPDNVKSRDAFPKTYLNAVVVGHLDSGKSTVSGRLVYECDAIEEDLMAKFEREANQANKAACKYAWIMDKLQTERDRGISIDTKLRRLETRKHFINLIDSPGHIDYVQNMITGASQADVAVLVVSARDGEFEHGVAKDGQTREHLHLAYSMGVKQLIVVVNKMDITAPSYSQKRYNFIVQNIDLLTKKAGFDPDTVIYIPISGWKGDNLVKRSENLAWYKQWQIERKSGGASGRTLIEAIDAMEQAPRLEKYPLRIAVHSVYKLGAVGIVAAGRIHSGFVRPGMDITLGPADIKTKVRAVQLHHDAVAEGYQGENVGIQIEGLDIKDVRKGFLIGETNRDPPKMVQMFTAQMVILNHPGTIKKGYTPMIHCHTACVPVKFVELKEKCDRRTGGQLETNPSVLTAGDACVVDLLPTKPICIESFFDYPTLGRFAIRDTKRTVAVGVIVNIPGRDPPQTDEDKWAVGRRPQTTGGRSVTFSLRQPDEYEKTPRGNTQINDEPTLRTKSGKLETEL